MLQTKEHIEQKMGYCACSYPLSGTRNLCAGEHSIWWIYTRRENIHIWLSKTMSMMTLHKVSWSSPCCWMALWRELTRLAWIPDCWYVLMARFKKWLLSLLLCTSLFPCKRKYKYSKMRIHPMKYYWENVWTKKVPLTSSMNNLLLHIGNGCRTQ